MLYQNACAQVLAVLPDLAGVALWEATGGGSYTALLLLMQETRIQYLLGTSGEGTGGCVNSLYLYACNSLCLVRLSPKKQKPKSIRRIDSVSGLQANFNLFPICSHYILGNVKCSARTILPHSQKSLLSTRKNHLSQKHFIQICMKCLILIQELVRN